MALRTSVSGDAGVGKTALLCELIRRLAPRELQCDDFGLHLPELPTPRSETDVDTSIAILVATSSAPQSHRRWREHCSTASGRIHRRQIAMRPSNDDQATAFRRSK